MEPFMQQGAIFKKKKKNIMDSRHDFAYAKYHNPSPPHRPIPPPNPCPIHSQRIM